MPEIPSEKNGMGASVLLLQEPREWGDEDWFDPCLSGYHPHPLYVVCTHFPE